MHAIPNIFKEEKKHPGQVLTSVTAEPKGLRVPCLAHFTPLLKPAVLPSNKERNFPVDGLFFQRTAQQDELSLYSLPFKNPVTTNTGAATHTFHGLMIKALDPGCVILF